MPSKKQMSNIQKKNKGIRKSINKYEEEHNDYSNEY